MLLCTGDHGDVVTAPASVIVKPVIDSAKKHFPYIAICRCCIDDVSVS